MYSKNLRAAIRPNKNFKRLYWRTDREQIEFIMSRLPQKYLDGIERHLHALENGFIYVRYDGFEFQIHHNNLVREKYKRQGKNVKTFNEKIKDLKNNFFIDRFQIKYEMSKNM